MFIPDGSTGRRMGLQLSIPSRSAVYLPLASVGEQADVMACMSTPFMYVTPGTVETEHMQPLPWLASI